MPQLPDDDLNTDPVDGEHDANTLSGGGVASSTWWGKLRRSEIARDDLADRRVDMWAERALKTQRWTIRMQWLAIAVLLAALLVAIGHEVGVSIPGVGEFRGAGGTITVEPAVAP